MRTHTIEIGSACAHTHTTAFCWLVFCLFSSLISSTSPNALVLCFLGSLNVSTRCSPSRSSALVPESQDPYLKQLLLATARANESPHGPHGRKSGRKGGLCIAVQHIKLLKSCSFQSNSNGLQPNSDGLQPTAEAMASNLIAMASNLKATKRLW